MDQHWLKPGERDLILSQTLRQNIGKKEKATNHRAVFKIMDQKISPEKTDLELSETVMGDSIIMQLGPALRKTWERIEWGRNEGQARCAETYVQTSVFHRITACLAAKPA